jgi:acyl-CoA thioester hydrolase
LPTEPEREARRYSSDRAAPLARHDFRRFLVIPTRWMDNDSYGHVNNVVYYSYFDTVVNEHLISVGGLDIRNAPAIGLVVETGCRFHRPLSFPGVVDAGLRVARLGDSSVRYDIGLFGEGEAAAAATGHFVHVWVERATNRPTRVPADIRAALADLLVAG